MGVDAVGGGGGGTAARHDVYYARTEELFTTVWFPLSGRLLRSEDI